MGGGGKKGGGSKSVTIGYKYFLGIHMVFCHGPVDYISKIFFGDFEGFNGTLRGGQLAINKPELFGGKEKEGGVSGTFVMNRGTSNQPIAYLVNQLGEENVSAYKGVVSLVSRQAYLGNNPYLKGISAVISRVYVQTSGEDQWYRERAGISPRNFPKDRPLALHIAISNRNTAGVANNIATAVEATYRLLQDIEEHIETADRPVHIKITAWSNTQRSIDKRNVDASDLQEIRDFLDTIEPQGNNLDYNLPIVEAKKFFPAKLATDKTPKKASGSYNHFFYLTTSGSNLASIEPAVDNSKDMWDRNGSDALTTINAFSTIAWQVFGAGKRSSLLANLFGRASTPGGNYKEQDGTAVNMHVGLIGDGELEKVLRLDNTPEDGVPEYSPGDWRALYADMLNAISSSEDGQDMNPAHIIRECLINKEWGLRESEDMINDASFRHAADVFFDEGMGFSFEYNVEGEIIDFIKEVANHADCFVYTDKVTGQWMIEPIRGDYDINDLPILSEDNFAIDEISRGEYGELVSAVNIEYTELIKSKTRSRTFYNLAAIQQLKTVNSTTVNYGGCMRDDLAERLAERDLLTLGYPLLTGSGTASREFSYLHPGAVVRVFLPRHELNGEVLRITEVEYGGDSSLGVKLSFVQDIYSLPKQPVKVDIPLNTPPRIRPPEPVEHRYVQETDYYHTLISTTQAILDDEMATDENLGTLTVLGGPPTPSTMEAVIWTRQAGSTGQYASRGSINMSPSFIISRDISRDPTDTVLPFSEYENVESFEEGFVGSINNELVVVKEVDAENGTVTVGRGVLDTVPEAHPSGSWLLAWSGYGSIVDNGYSAGMEEEILLQPKTITEELDPELADVDTVVFNSRIIRPYPPGNLRVNGTYVYEIDSLSGILNLTWAHRNRLQQTTEIIDDFTEGDIGPEPGVQYIVRVSSFDIDGNKRSGDMYEHNVGDDTSFSLALEGVFTPPDAANVVIEVVSIRDGYESWTAPYVTVGNFISPASLSRYVGAWYDSNDLTSMLKNPETGSLAQNDGDKINEMKNQKGTLL